MSPQDAQMVDLPSHFSFDETLSRLRAILHENTITLFAEIDHSGEAQRIGMTMPPTKLLIFGNPKAGTPLMLAAPSSAIDLPLKILVSEDAQGKTWLSYNRPRYLLQRHHLPDTFASSIEGVAAIAKKAAAAD